MTDVNAEGRPLDHPDFDPMFSVLEKYNTLMIWTVWQHSLKYGNRK